MVKFLKITIIFIGLIFYAKNLSSVQAINSTKSLQQIGSLLSFGRICSLDSGTNCPYIYIFYPVKSECVEIKCFPDLENLSPAEILTFNIVSQSFQKKTYSTAQSYKNKKDGYERNLLIDEYIEKIPFLWKLKCPHELKKVIAYFKRSVTALKINPTGDVPLLISLDYGAENTSHLKKNECPFFDSQDSEVEITEEEANFVKKYFKILSHNEAHLIFSLYHKMMVQVDGMKSSCHYWSNAAGFFTKFCNFIKNTLNDLGIAEVFYRLLLIQAIFFLESHSGLNIGSKIRSWIVKGAKRGTPSMDGDSPDEVGSRNASQHRPFSHDASSLDDSPSDRESTHNLRPRESAFQDQEPEIPRSLPFYPRSSARKQPTPTHRMLRELTLEAVREPHGLSRTTTSLGDEPRAPLNSKSLKSSKTHSVIRRGGGEKGKRSFELDSSRPCPKKEKKAFHHPSSVGSGKQRRFSRQLEPLVVGHPMAGFAEVDSQTSGNQTDLESS